MTPHTVCQWFEQLPELLLEGGWNKKVEEPNGELCHRKCPWGGQLLRLCTEISVQDMPQTLSPKAKGEETTKESSGPLGATRSARHLRAECTRGAQ